jgi:hypothetical protein
MKAELVKTKIFSGKKKRNIERKITVDRIKVLKAKIRRLRIR